MHGHGGSQGSALMQHEWLGGRMARRTGGYGGKYRLVWQKQSPTLSKKGRAVPGHCSHSGRGRYLTRRKITCPGDQSMLKATRGIFTNGLSF